MRASRGIDWRIILSMVPVAVLLGCGGSGGTGSTLGSATSTGAGTGTGTGTGTTATPSPTYDLASDFSRDRSFDAIGVRVMGSDGTAASVPGSRVDAESSAIGFSFTAATRTYHARYGDDMVDATTQQLSYSGTPYSYDQLQGTNPALTFTRSSGTNGIQYAGYVEWDTPLLNRYLVFGARTLGSDLPSGMSKTYAETATGTGSKITVDFAARTVTVSTTYQPSGVGNTGSAFDLPAAVPVTMSGVLDAAGRISGTVSYNGAAPSGMFEGALYGPKAAEAGLVFKVTRDTGELYFGYLLTRS